MAIIKLTEIYGEGGGIRGSTAEACRARSSHQASDGAVGIEFTERMD